MMTLTGSLATTIVLFTLAGTNASGGSPADRNLSVSAFGGSDRRPNQGDTLGAVGHRRTLAAHKKRKRKKQGASHPSDSGGGKSAEPDKGSDETDAGDDNSVSTEPDTKKEKASADSESAEKKAAAPAAEPTQKKHAKGSDEGGASDEAPAKAGREDEANEARPEALAVAVGPRVMARSLTYAQDIYSRNQRYSLPAAPMLGLSADFYPAALFSDGFAANLGLTAEAAYLLPVVSTAPPTPPGSYSARSLSWSGGAKVRLPLGIFVTAAYGDQRYELVPSGGAVGINIPTTEYKYVRGGAGIRYLATTDVSLMANAAYLHCLSLGPIGAAPNFPKGTCAAFEAGVAVGYRIGSRFEVRGGLDVRRYGLGFHQKAADFVNPQTDPTVKIAGGAIDQYISTWVALAILLDGHSGSAAHASGKPHRGATAAAPRPAPTEIQDDGPAAQ